jgi:hypothetical protein
MILTRNLQTIRTYLKADNAVGRCFANGSYRAVKTLVKPTGSVVHVNSGSQVKAQTDFSL